jgi:hypothetical protein
MVASEMLQTLRTSGFTVLLTPKLDVSITPTPTADLVEQLKTMKPDLVEILRAETWNPDNITDVCMVLIAMKTMPEPVAEKLDTLLSAAMVADWSEDATIRLTLAMTEAYARFANSKYKAAIWGGKTWLEAFGAGSERAKLAPIQRASEQVAA